MGESRVLGFYLAGFVELFVSAIDQVIDAIDGSVNPIGENSVRGCLEGCCWKALMDRAFAGKTGRSRPIGLNFNTLIEGWLSRGIRSRGFFRVRRLRVSCSIVLFDQISMRTLNEQNQNSTYKQMERRKKHAKDAPTLRHHHRKYSYSQFKYRSDEGLEQRRILN